MIRPAVRSAQVVVVVPAHRVRVHVRVRSSATCSCREPIRKVIRSRAVLCAGNVCRAECFFFALRRPQRVCHLLWAKPRSRLKKLTSGDSQCRSAHQHRVSPSYGLQLVGKLTTLKFTNSSPSMSWKIGSYQSFQSSEEHPCHDSEDHHLCQESCSCCCGRCR